MLVKTGCYKIKRDSLGRQREASKRQKTCRIILKIRLHQNNLTGNIATHAYCCIYVSALLYIVILIFYTFENKNKNMFSI